MKKNKLFSVLLSCVLVALVSCGLTAYADDTRVCINRIFYQLNIEDKTAIVLRGTQNSVIPGEIKIPSTINYNEVDYEVVEIADEAFSGNYELTCVIFEGCLRRIGDRAFDCCAVTYVDMHYGVDEFGEDAFIGTMPQRAKFFVPYGCVRNYSQRMGRPVRDPETGDVCIFCNE